MIILIKRKKEIIISLLTLLILGGLFFIIPFYNNYPKKQKNNDVAESIAIKNNFFDGLLLEAKSAFVWDARDEKVIYNFNSENQLPLASLTKLMTALVSSELVPSGTIITVNDSDINIEGNSNLKNGEKWNFKDILNFTLITSSNDGAHALAMAANSTKKSNQGSEENETFVDFMNKRAKKLGLTQTFFLNESGLDLNNGISGAYGSSRDMAILMSYIIKNKPEILEATKYSRLKIESKELTHLAENTNLNVEKIPGIISSKTGFTDLAGGNLIVAFDAGVNHPIIISVLGSTHSGRFDDVEKLIQATIDSLGE